MYKKKSKISLLMGCKCVFWFTIISIVTLLATSITLYNWGTIFGKATTCCENASVYRDGKCAVFENGAYIAYKEHIADYKYTNESNIIPVVYPDAYLAACIIKTHNIPGIDVLSKLFLNSTFNEIKRRYKNEVTILDRLSLANWLFDTSNSADIYLHYRIIIYGIHDYVRYIEQAAIPEKFAYNYEAFFEYIFQILQDLCNISGMKHASRAAMLDILKHWCDYYGFIIGDIITEKTMLFEACYNHQHINNYVAKFLHCQRATVKTDSPRPIKKVQTKEGFWTKDKQVIGKEE